MVSYFVKFDSFVSNGGRACVEYRHW